MISNIQRIRVYDGFFKMDKFIFNQARFDGITEMVAVTREVLVRNPVVFLSLFDPATGQYLMTEQVRVGAIANDTASCCVMEPIAGIIDDGETPLQAAVREAKEESNIDIDIDSISIMWEGYTSSGGSSEYAYFATGLFDSSNYTPSLGGVAGEQEDIRTHLLTVEQLMSLPQDTGSMTAGFGMLWHQLNSVK